MENDKVDQEEINAEFLRRDLITFIEQYWHQNGCYPTPLALARYADTVNLDEQTVKHLERQVAFSLSERGISKKQTDRLTPIQIAALQIMLDPANSRLSFDKRLRMANVTSTKWQGWLKQPHFLKYLTEQTERLFGETDHLAKIGLLRGVEKGDPTSLKLYFGLTGQLQNDAATNNVQVIMAYMIEAIQRHVTDPDVMRAIAADFELAMLKGGGQTPMGMSTRTIHQPTVIPSRGLESASIAEKDEFIEMLEDNPVAEVTSNSTEPVVEQWSSSIFNL